ncbi:hypothetical protein PMIN02_009698 [Paraphaeosphaeria minitans]|uniref:Uncharacterized protein n=1 Tax=Paraphaeosphaeria minitans TaxID=565426 RepID=A0A9P6GWH6_9PLEO|nr:hypothetical protein PMIN01_01008 [Paraphaeosphaeria minitans]
MVYYPVLKYIKKSDLRQAGPFTFSEDAKRADHSAALATCMAKPGQADRGLRQGPRQAMRPLQAWQP